MSLTTKDTTECNRVRDLVSKEVEEEAMKLLTCLRQKFNLPNPPRCDADDVTLMFAHLTGKL